MAEAIEAPPPRRQHRLARALLERFRRAYEWLLTDDEWAAELAAAAAAPPEVAAPAAPAMDQPAVPSGAGWQPTAPELAALLWGEGWTLPLGEHMTTVMVRAFGLNKEMSVLDLTGGLGASAAMIVEGFGSYVTALEPDAALAERGAHELKQRGVSHHATLAPYAPETFQAKRRYDGIIARDLFFRMADKAALVAEIAKSLKDHAQISWTDLVLADDATADGALAPWLQQETPGNKPLRLAEVEALWKKHKVELRVSEDRTGHYVDAVQEAIVNLARELAKRPLAPAAKAPIMAQVEFWVRRVDALRHGLRFYRFYGTKH